MYPIYSITTGGGKTGRATVALAARVTDHMFEIILRNAVLLDMCDVVACPNELVVGHLADSGTRSLSDNYSIGKLATATTSAFSIEAGGRWSSAVQPLRTADERRAGSVRANRRCSGTGDHAW